MNANNYKQALLAATEALYAEKTDYLALSTAIKAYKKLLLELSALDENTSAAREDIHHANGKALGSFWAALCVDDIVRTKQFVHGIYRAIDDLKTQGKQKISILYAGTGPFATLLLPNMLRFPKDLINYTFMEINPISMEGIQRLCAKLDMEDYAVNFVSEDASTYQIPEEVNYDIIISETLQAGLAKEQQVPIFLNLMKQSSPSTIFIPQKIELQLALKENGIAAEALTPAHYHKVATVLEVSKRAWERYLKDPSPKMQQHLLKEVSTLVSKDAINDANTLFLLTHLQVYKETQISINESSLTIPLYLNRFSEAEQKDKTIQTQYIIDGSPRLDFQIS